VVKKDIQEENVMVKKIALVGAIVAIVIVSYFIMTAAMPAISEMTGVAANATNIEDYAGSLEVVQSAPMWLYAIPAVVGGIAIIIVLRRKE